MALMALTSMPDPDSGFSVAEATPNFELPFDPPWFSIASGDVEKQLLVKAAAATSDTISRILPAR